MSQGSTKPPADKIADDKSPLRGVVWLPLYRMRALPLPFRASPDDLRKADAP